MVCQVIWAPSARLDLRDIFDYIARDNTSAARRFVEKTVEAVERLATFPESGRIVPEFGEPSIREIVRRPFRVVYRLHEERQTVEVVRIWHAARGIPQV